MNVAQPNRPPVLFPMFVILVLLPALGFACDDKETKPEAKSDAIGQKKIAELAVQRLVKLQHQDGAWPYEGVYRVRGKIPVGYRIGGTSIVCSALLSTKFANQKDVMEAVGKGIDLILDELEDPRMKPSRTNAYDVRIWGHIYALDFFCRLKQFEGLENHREKTDPWIEKLADAIVFQEVEGGGWNYSNKRRQCCFVTAPAVQSLLLAKQIGKVKVPEDVLKRSAKILQASRKSELIYPYMGTNARGNTAPGSIARGPVSESTLMLLGWGDQQQIQATIDAFHEHWDELEKRRKKNGTHLPPHGIAPYYFYYGHRYVAQAIRMLPTDKRDKEFKKFEAVLFKTKDPDDTWNDRVFEQSKAYGTAMSLLALSRDLVILPNPETIKLDE